MLNLLYPKNCIICGRFGKYLCSNCIVKKLIPNYFDSCAICGKYSDKGEIHKNCKDKTFLDNIFWFCKYNNYSEKVILSVKYGGLFDVFKEVSNQLSRTLKLSKINNASITYVPLHSYKRNLRGFNQAEVLANEIAKITKLDITELIIRTRNTKTQVKLNKNERSLNLKKAFKVNQNIKIPTTVIIVDDVFTTGTTLNECAKLLKEAGVRQVYGLVFAKAGP